MTDAERDAASAASRFLLAETRAEAKALKPGPHLGAGMNRTRTATAYSSGLVDRPLTPLNEALPPLLISKISCIVSLLKTASAGEVLGTSFAKLIDSIATPNTWTELQESLETLGQLIGAMDAGRNSRPPERGVAPDGRQVDVHEGVFNREKPESVEFESGQGSSDGGEDGRGDNAETDVDEAEPASDEKGIIAKPSSVSEDALVKRALDKLLGSPVTKILSGFVSLALVTTISFAVVDSFKIGGTSFEIMQRLRDAGTEAETKIGEANAAFSAEALKKTSELNELKSKAVDAIVIALQGRTAKLDSQLSGDEKIVTNFQPQIDRLKSIAEDIQKATADGGVATLAAKARMASDDAVHYRDAVIDTLKGINSQLAEKASELNHANSKIDQLESDAKRIDLVLPHLEKIKATTDEIDKIERFGGLGNFEQQAREAANKAENYSKQTKSGLESLDDIIAKDTRTLQGVHNDISGLETAVKAEKEKVCGDAGPDVQLQCLKGWMTRLEGELVHPGGGATCETTTPNSDMELLPEEWLAIQQSLQLKVGLALTLDGDSGAQDSQVSKTRAAIRAWHAQQASSKALSSALSSSDICTLIRDWQKAQAHPAPGTLSVAETRSLNKFLQTVHQGGKTKRVFSKHAQKARSVDDMRPLLQVG